MYVYYIRLLLNSQDTCEALWTFFRQIGGTGFLYPSREAHIQSYQSSAPKTVPEFQGTSIRFISELVPSKSSKSMGRWLRCGGMLWLGWGTKESTMLWHSLAGQSVETCNKNPSRSLDFHFRYCLNLSSFPAQSVLFFISNYNKVFG